MELKVKELQELIQLISDSNLAEFKMEAGEMKLSIRTKHYSNVKTTQVTSQPIIPMQASVQPVTQVPMQQQLQPSPVAAPPSASSTDEPGRGEEDDKYIAVRSPIVGTFYRSPAPDKPPFIKVGDSISTGSVVCIVEAMKLFNEIESEVTGRVVKVLVEDASPVEYDTVLFLVDPNG